jgi:hypothetical protein
MWTQNYIDFLSGLVEQSNMLTDYENNCGNHKIYEIQFQPQNCGSHKSRCGSDKKKIIAEKPKRVFYEKKYIINPIGFYNWNASNSFYFRHYNIV